MSVVYKYQKRKLVYGIGINDADYPISPFVDGKQVPCPYYRVWQSMIGRCYSKSYQKRQPTYIGCTVCDEWLYFMTFRAWMVTQDWEGKALDKDFINGGNKTYNSDNCMFIEQGMNNFLTDNGRVRGEYPLGVGFRKTQNRFIARVSYKSKRKSLGKFTCPIEAHRAWQEAKLKIAHEMLLVEDNPRVKVGIKRIVDQLQYDIDNNLETIKL